MRELKQSVPYCAINLGRRTLPRVRELKPTELYGCWGSRSRTLPRVRELKHRGVKRLGSSRGSRTLPRVRELKLSVGEETNQTTIVAPFPGCVN